MRVRCERILLTAGPRRGYEAKEESAPGESPRVGTEYLVLSIRAQVQPPGGILPVDLLILNDAREPIWVAAAMFSVSSGTLPTAWRARIRNDGELELAPQPWLSDVFWGEYYGDDAEVVRKAHDTFRQGLAAIEAEEAL